LDRIIASKAGLDPEPQRTPAFTYEEIRRKLGVLIQEKRFIIYVLLQAASPHGLTLQEISKAIGTGLDRFEFHLAVLCRERILSFSKVDGKPPQFRINETFALAATSFFGRSGGFGRIAQQSEACGARHTEGGEMNGA